MKVNGREVPRMSPKYVVIPKGEQEFVFQALPVLDYSDFDKLCPVPNPPEILRPGGERSFDVEDADYNKSLTDYSRQKYAWMMITSLRATEGLVWETVDYAKPETWENYGADLHTAFADAEVARILDAVHTACGLNQEKIDEATKRFLAGLAKEQEKQ